MEISEIMFVAKFHKSNGCSFYIPTKLTKWFGLSFDTYNNTVFIMETLDSEPIKIDCTATRHKDTWKLSFYTWDANGLKSNRDYLFRIAI